MRLLLLALNISMCLVKFLSIFLGNVFSVGGMVNRFEQPRPLFGYFCLCLGA